MEHHCSIQDGYKIFCVIVIKKKDELMVQDIGMQIRPTWVKAFAREKTRDFDDDGYWLKLIHEGSNKMRIK